MKAASHAHNGHHPGLDRRDDRVRARILFPFTLVILFVVGVFVVAAYLYEDRQREHSLTDNIAAVERLFRQGLESDALMMEAALTAISLDAELKETFLKRDRQGVLRLAWPVFDTLREQGRITHFYFTGPDRVNFLRVHQPDQFGDTIDRISTLRAAETQGPTRGIELGPLGTFSLRVVVPWYDGKRLIGYLELGEEIDHIANSVHTVLGADLLVLVYEQLLDPQQWEIGAKLLGQADKRRRFGDTVLVGRAMEKIPEALVMILERGDHNYDGVLRLEEGGRSLYVAFLPLTDISGKEVGDFIVVRDVTDSRAEFRNVIVSIAAVSVLVGALVFFAFYVILGRVERDYRRQREVELQLSRVNTEHQRVIQVEKLSAMGLMIGEIAHQLNNPLVGVINMAQLAERGVDDPERTKELLGEIGQAGKDCHAFVKRMLEFTKISCFEQKSTNMNLLVEDAVALFRQSVGTQANVVLDLPKTAPILDVDPVLIRHAIFNLLSNAVQAGPAGGTIAVNLYFQMQSVPGWCIAVRDHGHGLAGDVMNKIFTPFFTTRAEGTGLGLPVVQHVAILHEGEITAANAEGGGALFTLWLPETRG